MDLNLNAAGLVVAVVAQLLVVYRIRRGDLERMDQRMHAHERDLAEFKTEAAQRYATQEAIHRIEERVLSEFRSFAERFDRFLLEWRSTP